MDQNSSREAYHAGSWYSKDKTELNQQLNSWLENAKFELKHVKEVKAIIGPHAGYAYSGPTQAWAYKYMKFAHEDPLRVFLLGPCHHVYIRGCGLSSLKNYKTPLGSIELDTETIEKLKTEGKFAETDKETEEEEHSLEMHLPYIKKAFDGRKIKLIPVMVGSIDKKLEEYYGDIFAKYFDDPNSLFCISSDFCHWGKRFQYTRYDKDEGAIHEYIEKLDKAGMKLIEEHNVNGFATYLEQTDNTICGRHPIGVLLNIINKSKYRDQMSTKFVRYAQSEPVKSANQSSVSYASAVTFIKDQH